MEKGSEISKKDSIPKKASTNGKYFLEDSSINY